MKKISFSIITFLICMAIGVMSIHAFANKITFAERGDRLTLNDSFEVVVHPTTDNTTYPWFPYKSEVNGTPAICLSGLHVPGSDAGMECTLTDWSDIKQSYGVAYILSAFSGISDANTRYYFQEILIQHYLGVLVPNDLENLEPDLINTDITLATTGKTWNQIITGAQNAANNTDTTAASITVDGEKSAIVTFTLNEDGYYYSTPVTIDANTSVTAANSTNTKFEVSSDGITYTFKIKATDIDPGETENLAITLAVSKSYKVASRYYCGEGYQEVALATTENVVTNDSVTISGSVKRNYTAISKKNAVNGSDLPGATLEILDNTKQSISCYMEDGSGNQELLDKCEWVSTDEPKLIFELPEGKYYLRENIAPEGYVLSESMVMFDVSHDAVTEVEMSNDLEVEVPDTLSPRSALLVAIAMFDIALGIGIITYVKKNKIKE